MMRSSERKNAINIGFYNVVRSGSNTNLQGSKDPWFKNLMAMYMGCKDVDEERQVFPGRSNKNE